MTGIAAKAGYLAIIWHSRTGAARALAQAVEEGARRALAEGEVRRIAAPDTRADDLLGAAGIVFVCPENLGGMTGPMKDMFERTYYEVLGRIEGRAYATVIAAGSDGSGAQREIDRIVTGWRLKRIADPIIANQHAQSVREIAAPKVVDNRQLDIARNLGEAFGTGLRLGVF